MIKEKVDDYLQNLKDKEYNIKRKLELIEKLKTLITNIESKVEDIEYNKRPTYKIGIWNDELTRKVVKQHTVVYDMEEYIADEKGDFEYLTDVSSDVLLKALRDAKAKYQEEIKNIEEDILLEMGE